MILFFISAVLVPQMLSGMMLGNSPATVTPLWSAPLNAVAGGDVLGRSVRGGLLHYPPQKSTLSKRKFLKTRTRKEKGHE